MVVAHHRHTNLINMLISGVYVYMQSTCLLVVNIYDCKHVHASNNVYELVLFSFHDCVITKQVLDLFSRLAGSGC